MITFPPDEVCCDIVRNRCNDQKRLRRALLVLHILDGKYLGPYSWCKGAAGMTYQGDTVRIGDDRLYECRSLCLTGALVVARRGILRDPFSPVLEYSILEDIARASRYTGRHTDLWRRDLTLTEFNDHKHQSFQRVRVLVETAKRVTRMVLEIGVMYKGVVKELKEEFEV